MWLGFPGGLLLLLLLLLSCFSHVRLLATPWTAGPSVHRIFQAKVLEWGAIAGGFFTTAPPVNRLATHYDRKQVRNFVS